MNKKGIVLFILLFFLSGCGKEVKYVCLNGYTLNEERHICQRVVEEEAKENYYCEEQGRLEDKKCKIYHLSQAKVSRVCNPGYYPEGGVCIKDGTIANYGKCGVDKMYDIKTDTCYDKVQIITLYKCEEGELDGTTCVTITYEDAKLEYLCPKGYELEGQKCYRTITMDAVKEDA